MATANLKKSKEFVINTTAASKYILRRPKISINWNPTFQTFFWCKFSKMKNFKKFWITPKFVFALQFQKKLNKSCSFEKKILFLKKNFYSMKFFFWNFMKWDLKDGISIYADSGPPTLTILSSVPYIGSNWQYKASTAKLA